MVTAARRLPHAILSIQLSVLSLALAAVITLAACAGLGGGDRLTVYSGRGEDLVGPLLEQFDSDTGIGVDVRYGDSADVALLIDEEAENTPADVFYSQSPGATGFLMQQQRLAALPDEVLEMVDERFRHEDGQWVGVTGRQRVLVYNSELVDEEDLPASVLEVASEPYAGRVAVAPSNASFQDFVSALRLQEGDDVARAWLEGLAQAGAPTYANNNAIVEAAGRGEIEMGLVNHYYNYRFLEEDPDLPTRNYVFGGGDIGSLVIPSAVSITAASDNPDAQRLVEYLLSEEAQRFFAEETKEYPLAAGVEPAEGVPPLDPAAAPAVSHEQLGGGLEATLEMIRASGLDD